MLSLTVNSRKSLSLSTAFLPNNHPAPPSNPQKVAVKSRRPITSLIIPPSSGQRQSNRPPPPQQQQQQQQQQLYQPFRPPPSPLPPKYRNLDTSAQLEVLTNRLGIWFEYAPLIPYLTRDGFTPSNLEEITGITGIDQNRLVVGAQVRDTLVECGLDPETLSYFDSSGAELLYEIRLLSTRQRADAASFVVRNEFDAKKTEELARSMKDFPRRRVDYGWGKFNCDSPGDCLAFMYFRQAQEYAAAGAEDLKKIWIEKGLEFVESEDAKNLLVEEVEGKEVDKESVVDDGVSVPLVKLQLGEIAESTIVVVLPVCKADKKAFEVGVEVEAAPWECGGVGDFGLVEAEKAWQRWVVLPAWQPIAGLERGGVAVAFKNGNVLPWREKRQYKKEPILVVIDRCRKEVVADNGFYLVVGGNGSIEDELKVERGSTLKEMGVEQSLGMVLVVVRPPKDDDEEDLSAQDWD